MYIIYLSYNGSISIRSRLVILTLNLCSGSSRTSVLQQAAIIFMNVACCLPAWLALAIIYSYSKFCPRENQQKVPGLALFIRKEWFDNAFEPPYNKKVVEIAMRKGNVLVGEVCLARCLTIGQECGELQPNTYIHTYIHTDIQTYRHTDIDT